MKNFKLRWEEDGSLWVVSRAKLDGGTGLFAFTLSPEAAAFLGRVIAAGPNAPIPDDVAQAISEQRTVPRKVAGHKADPASGRA